MREDWREAVQRSVQQPISDNILDQHNYQLFGLSFMVKRWLPKIENMSAHNQVPKEQSVSKRVYSFLYVSF